MSCQDANVRSQEEEKKNVDQKNSSENDPDYSYAIQVETSVGYRWQSSGLQVNDEIPVVPIDSNHQYWYLQRNEYFPLWSFHKKSADGKKLFVSYKHDIQNEKVTLQCGGADNFFERSFHVLRQPGIGFMLTSPLNHQRFLGLKDGKLVMTETAQEWIVLPEGTDESEQFLETYHQIQRDNQAGLLWISDQAEPEDNVRVEQSSQQEWSVSGSASSTSFKVPDQDFYASRNNSSEEEVLFESPLGKSIMREFAVKSDPKIPPPAVVIQSNSNSRYIGTSNNILQLQQTVSEAGGWELLTTSIVFRSKGQTIVFPPFVVRQSSSAQH